MTATVRPIDATEVEAWCACPFDPGHEGYHAHVEEERDWLGRWYGDDLRLYAYVDDDGTWLGKYDVPIVFARRWTLWAPTVLPGKGATDRMEALCEDVAERAEEAHVEYVRVLLEGGHRTQEAAETGLARAGFLLDEERVLVRADLAPPLDVDAQLPADISVVGASDLDLWSEGRTLARAVGLTDADLDEIRADQSGRPLWIAMEEDGEPIGMVLASSCPGAEVLTEFHLGLVPEARGRGLGLPLLLAFLELGRETGSRLYIGSTATDNLAMRRIFALAGCEEFASRYVYGLEIA